MRISDWSSDVCSSDLVLGLLTSGRLLAHHPRAAEVGVEAVVDDAAVDPEHVAGHELSLGAEQRAGDAAVHRPGQLVLVGGHDLPDGVEGVGLCAELEHEVTGSGGEVDLASAGAPTSLDPGQGP